MDATSTFSLAFNPEAGWVTAQATFPCWIQINWHCVCAQTTSCMQTCSLLMGVRGVGWGGSGWLGAGSWEGWPKRVEEKKNPLSSCFWPPTPSYPTHIHRLHSMVQQPRGVERWCEALVCVCASQRRWCYRFWSRGGGNLCPSLRELKE